MIKFDPKNFFAGLFALAGFGLSIWAFSHDTFTVDGNTMFWLILAYSFPLVTGGAALAIPNKIVRFIFELLFSCTLGNLCDELFFDPEAKTAPEYVISFILILIFSIKFTIQQLKPK